TDRAKAGNALYGAYGQDFECADGQRVMVIGLTDRQWRGLVEATGMTDDMASLERQLGLSLRDEGNRWLHRAEITKRLAPWFAARRVDDFEEDFNARGLTWSVFRTVHEALAEDDDLSTANPMFQDIHHPGLGTFLTPRHPADFGANDRADATPAPTLGAHTEEILGDVLGLGDRAIGTLFDKGIVDAPGRRAQPTAA
ncbi:MAG: CoA transferase, partial [Pseudomonadota bacterium]